MMGSRSVFGGGDFDGGGEGVEEMDEEGVDGVGDSGSCGYKGVVSSIAIFWSSSSGGKLVFDTAFILASSITSVISSTVATV